MRADPSQLLFSTPMRYFAAVADAGSVSRAAHQLHVAASAVSRQVAALEDALGVALFERRQRGMRLTAAGERLAAHLRVAADDGRAALLGVQALHDEAERRVRLDCTEGFAQGLLPEVLASFRAAHPQVLLEIGVAAPDAVIARLARREADLGLLFAMGQLEGARVLHEGAAPLAALMRRDHPLAARARLTLAEVVRHPLLLGTPGTTARALFESACAQRGLRWQASIVASALAPMLALLAGDEIALASLGSARHLAASGSLVYVPFAEGELPPRRWVVAGPRGREPSALVRALIEGLTQALA